MIRGSNRSRSGRRSPLRPRTEIGPDVAIELSGARRGGDAVVVAAAGEETSSSGGNDREDEEREAMTLTPYSAIILRYLNEDRGEEEGKGDRRRRRRAIFGTAKDHDRLLRVDRGERRPAAPSRLWRREDDERFRRGGEGDGRDGDREGVRSCGDALSVRSCGDRAKEPSQILLRVSLVLLASFCYKFVYNASNPNNRIPGRTKLSLPSFYEFLSRPLSFWNSESGKGNFARPKFVFEHPYATSSYYTATTSVGVLQKMREIQVEPKRGGKTGLEGEVTSRLAILRPFCEFDAGALATTFACWNSLVPCRVAEMDLDDEDEDDDDVNNEWSLFDMSVNGTGRKLPKGQEDRWECEAEAYHGAESSQWRLSLRGITNGLFKRCRRRAASYVDFDDVPPDRLRARSVDLFLFYSQTYSENHEAVEAVDQIMEEFFNPGGWSRCFDNIYAVEANIPKELDLYIPAAQEELYNWVNGPNRQYEAGFRIIQSGEWGDYDGFYLMEGDSVPVKNYWLDVILGEIDAHRPFAVLGAQYDGDKWDSFYEDIPISLLHHTNGNGIYNTSHPLLERLTGQLEVEAPCPYNSIPYDYRMSQMWVEGTLGIVPKLAPKIMLNQEGQNVTLSDNRAMFSRWASRWKDEEPFKFTKAIHNYAATNLIPRHLGPEYVVHGAKLYSPWNPARTEITLVVMEWFFDRSLNLIEKLDSKDHPFSEVIVMMPPSVSNTHDYTDYTRVPVSIQYRDAMDYMDLCSAHVKTEWFMITNAYHQVSRHVDLMFTPGKFVPVVPFTPATYPFCLKYPYCKETVLLSQRWNPKHKQVVLDMDMVYHTKERNNFCQEWIERNGEEGENLYAKHQPLRWKLRGEKIIGPKGPTGTDYLAYLAREKLDGEMYKMTDRSLYGARSAFTKVYRKEEKLDGMSEDELARRLGMTLLSNTTDCSCDRFETEEECLGSGLGCQWRPLFESCHPPEMIDDGLPICETTEPPTMSPSISIDRMLQETKAPTVASDSSSESEGADGSHARKNARDVLTSLFKTREHETDTGHEEGAASRNLLASTKSPTVATKMASAGELDVPLSPGLQSILANAETRNWALEQLSIHPSLGRRVGAKIFRRAADREIRNQLSNENRSAGAIEPAAINEHR